MLMNRLKLKLSRLNGWRRAWLVLSVVGILYAMLILPIIEAKDLRVAIYTNKFAVQRELNNPECVDYINNSLSSLPRPQYSFDEGRTGCYHLYTQRESHNPSTVPYTQTQLDKDIFIQVWSYTGLLSLLFVVVAMILSAVAYFSGFVISWIMSGFNKNPSQ